MENLTLFYHVSTFSSPHTDYRGEDDEDDGEDDDGDGDGDDDEVVPFLVSGPMSLAPPITTPHTDCRGRDDDDEGDYDGDGGDEDADDGYGDEDDDKSACRQFWTVLEV